GECGVSLREFGDGSGALRLFFRPASGQRPDPYTQYRFEAFAVGHLEKGALTGSVKLTRRLALPICWTPVPQVWADGMVAQGWGRWADRPGGHEHDVPRPRGADLAPRAAAGDRRRSRRGPAHGLHGRSPARPAGERDDPSRQAGRRTVRRLSLLQPGGRGRGG